MRHVCRLKGNVGAADIRLTGQVQAIGDIQRQVVFPIPLPGIFGQVSEQTVYLLVVFVTSYLCDTCSDLLLPFVAVLRKLGEEHQLCDCPKNTKSLYINDI